eukprot:1353298-Rhodomonas_salina.1
MPRRHVNPLQIGAAHSIESLPAWMGRLPSRVVSSYPPPGVRQEEPPQQRIQSKALQYAQCSAVLFPAIHHKRHVRSALAQMRGLTNCAHPGAPSAGRSRQEAAQNVGRDEEEKNLG